MILVFIIGYLVHLNKYLKFHLKTAFPKEISAAPKLRNDRIVKASIVARIIAKGKQNGEALKKLRATRRISWTTLQMEVDIQGRNSLRVLPVALPEV
jgi:hypothetical protein